MAPANSFFAFVANSYTAAAELPVLGNLNISRPEETEYRFLFEALSTRIAPPDVAGSRSRVLLVKLR